MKNVLNPMHDDGPGLALHIEDSLDSQETFPAGRLHDVHPLKEPIPGYCILQRDAERTDTIVVPVNVSVFALMAMTVVVGVVMLGVSFFVQPVFDVGGFGLGIVKSRIE